MSIKHLISLILSCISFVCAAQVAPLSSKETAKGFVIENFSVSGNCGMCQKNIEAACIGKGVKAAFWDKNTQKLSVKYSPKKTSADNILGRVAAAGYDTEKQQANPAAYLALPACCHYREQPNSH